MWDSWRQLRIEKQRWDCRRPSKNVKIHTKVIKTTSFSEMCPSDLKAPSEESQSASGTWCALGTFLVQLLLLYTPMKEKHTHLHTSHNAALLTTRLHNTNATTSLIRVKRETDGWTDTENPSLNSGIEKQTWLAQGHRWRENQADFLYVKLRCINSY